MKHCGLRVVAAVGLLGSLLAACGSSSTNKDVGTDGGATACADYIQKFCDRLQTCVPGTFAVYGFASIADCTAYYVPGCRDNLAAPHTGETVALVQKCGDELAAMSCTDVVQGASAPDCLPRGGTISNGGPCNSGWQCASGNCFVPLSVINNSGDFCGTCVPVVPLGQACNPNGVFGSDCADSLVCAVPTAGATTPVCTKTVAIGAACADPAVCGANAYCDQTTHLCTKLPTIGQTCDPGAIYYCDPTKPAALCDYTTSVCKSLTLAKAGESCMPANPDTLVSCSGSCAAPADAGQDAGLGTCQPFVLDGQPCTASDICVLGTACTAGLCKPPVCGGAGSSAIAVRRPKLIRIPSAAPAPGFSARH